jgi:hypothetical protein
MEEGEKAEVDHRKYRKGKMDAEKANQNKPPDKNGMKPPPHKQEREGNVRRESRREGKPTNEWWSKNANSLRMKERMQTKSMDGEKDKKKLLPSIPSKGQTKSPTFRGQSRK